MAEAARPTGGSDARWNKGELSAREPSEAAGLLSSLLRAVTFIPLILTALTATELRIVNHGALPVHATAVTLPAGELTRRSGLPADAALEAVDAHGVVTPLHPGREAERAVVRALVSLAPGEERRLTVRRAAAPASSPAQARFEAATGRGEISNGILTLRQEDSGWSLLFSAPGKSADSIASDRMLVRDGHLEAWLDAERRGRLMNIDPAPLGLVPTHRARIAAGEAAVTPDGAAQLTLRRAFDGAASAMTLTETFTLAPGRPVLEYRAAFTNRGSAPFHLAYVEHGGAVRGTWGPLLRREPFLKYENPAAPTPLLLSGPSNSFTRLAWRSERAWVGVSSGSGAGLGVTTRREITRDLPGSTIWSLTAGGFTLPLLDPEQGNFPWTIAPGATLESGLAFTAATGGANAWRQARETFLAVTRDRPPAVPSACSVYLDGVPLAGGEVPALKLEDAAPPVVVRLNLSRPHQLVAALPHRQARPVRITARPLEGGEAVTVLTLEDDRPRTVDFTALTGWSDGRREFILETDAPAGTRLRTLHLAPAPPAAPVLSVPADGARLTDLAVHFRWKGIPGVIDYEVQLAQSPAFTGARTLSVRSEIEWPVLLPADADLPSPGAWYWRVRATEAGEPGAWSAARRMEIDGDRMRRPVRFDVSPEKPLFTFEVFGGRDLRPFARALPADLRPFSAINVAEKFDVAALHAPLAAAGQRSFIRTHHPGPHTGWTPLSEVEAAFQAHDTIVGIMGGETLSAWYHGGQAQVYLERLLRLCGKYGRLMYEADGTYPNENKWEAAYARIAPLLREYRDHLVLAQKNNILHRQFVSQSSVLGLHLAGEIAHQGSWEDGGWYWQQVGFRRLGEIHGQRGGVVRDMPRNFWNLTFAMGLARGCTVFSLEGQTGTVRVPASHRLAEHGVPEKASPSAYWTSNGELTPTFHRFVAPFLRGILRHQLVPTRTQVTANVRLAVWNDGVTAGSGADPYYFQYQPLYAGTYGFRPQGVIPGELMEFFPNTGRYHYFPLLPAGRADLGKGIETVPLSALRDPNAVRARFDAAYPAWYEGDALVSFAGDTLTVLNTRENADVTENYSVPFKERGPFRRLAGRIGPHAYLVGKFENRNRRLWLQANTEYPERPTELTLGFATHPKVTVTPAAAAQVNRWDPATRTLQLTLDHTAGAVEAVIEELDAAYVPVTDDPRLPRVLLIGDSVSIAYTLDVRRELAGVANVHRIPANGGSTRTALGPHGLDRWLDGTKWDVIHFNFGLHDLSYRFPDDTDRDAAGNYATPRNGGRPNVPPERYAEDLRTVVRRLKQTGARLVFATTTPVPESDAGKYVRGSEEPYNRIARALMAAEGVAVNDLWAAAAPRIAELQIPRNVHFHARGSAELAKRVAAAIRAELAAGASRAQEIRTP